MSDRKIIAIAGATGAQGGGLARAILSDADSQFTVRALTRDPSSDKAKALADMGADVVQADLNDVDSIKAAFDGSYGAYCVTFFWEHFNPETELAQAKSMADAAKATNLQHVIWSTLDDTRLLVPLSDDRMPTLQDKYKVPHFDAKGEANKFFTESGVPYTILNTSFYWDNLIYFGSGPQRGEDGKLAFVLPMDDKRLPGIAVADIGKCAYGIFKRGDQYIGKTLGIAGEHLTGQEMADALTEALGEEVVYNYVPPEVYRTFDFPGADDLANMFQYKRDFEAEYTGARNLDETRALNPELFTFKEWLKENAKSIPIG